MRFILKLLVLFTSFNSFSQSYPSSWASKGVGGGGAIVAASISPFNANEFYLTCDMSNLFNTTNFGQSYSMIPFTELQVQLKSEVQFTSIPSKLFVLSKLSSGYTPMKSYNNGINWKAATNPGIGSLYQLFASPHDTDQVIISDKNKIYFSNTDNTVGSYTTLMNYPSTYGAHIAGVYFENKDTVYVCSHDSLIYTFNGGGTWAKSPVCRKGILSNDHIISFKGAKQGNKWVFYCVTIRANVLPKGIYNSSGRDCTVYKNIYKLSQGKMQWDSLGYKLPNPNVDKGYLLGLADNDTSTVYVGGNSTYLGVTLGAIFKSINGGNTFTNTFLHSTMFNFNTNITTGWGGKQANPSSKFTWNGVNYMLALAVDPNNSSRLICGDGMWAHSSIDKGVNWQQIYTDFNYDNSPSTLIQQSKKYLTTGLETTASYWLNWTSPTKIFASYNDIVARRSDDGGNFWSFDIYGLDSSKINDINMTLFNPSNGLMYAAAGEQPGSNGDYTDFRVTQFRGRLSLSLDTGKTWSTLKTFSGRSVTSIAFDPNSSTGMYATVIDTLGGIGDVYHCVNIISNPNNWIKLSSPPRTQGRPLQIIPLKDGSLLSVYGARDFSTTSTSNSFTPSSGVFTSTNGGISWIDVTPIGGTIETVNVEVDPNDISDSTWLAFVGTKVGGSPGVYRTTNRGLSWANVYNQGVLSGSFHPSLSNELYICTETNGLVYATNTNSNSFLLTPITSYPFRRPQKVFFNPYNVNEVWVASFGNGFRMGTTSLSSGVSQIKKETETIKIFPNPASNYITVKADYQLHSTDKFSIVDLNGKALSSVFSSEGNTITIDINNLSSGIYLLKILSGSKGETVTKKFVVLK